MKLVHLAEARDVEGVLRELGALTPDERAAQAEALEARRATLRAGWFHDVPEEGKAAQLAAELGCRIDPATAADWILQPENGSNVVVQPLGGAWTLDVVNLHPVAWRAELAAHLADRSTPGNGIRSDLVEHLVHDTGCPVPTSDGFIDSWLRWRDSTWEQPAHLRGGARPGATFLERLRADDLSPLLLPLVLERPGVHLGAGSFHHMLTRRGLAYIMEDTRLGAANSCWPATTSDTASPCAAGPTPCRSPRSPAALRDSRCTWPWRTPSCTTSSANATRPWTRCSCSPREDS